MAAAAAAAAIEVSKLRVPGPIPEELLVGLKPEHRWMLFDGTHQYVCTEARNPHWLAQLGLAQPWGPLEAERVPAVPADAKDLAPEAKQDAPVESPAKSSGGGGLGGWFGWGSSAAPAVPASPATRTQLERERIEKLGQLRQQPLERVFDEPEQEIFNIRGANYLEDGVKIPTPPFAMRLIGVDCFVCASDEEIDANAFIAGRPDLLVQRARAARAAYEAKLSPEELAELREARKPAPGAGAADEKDLFGHGDTTHPFVFVMHFLLPGAHCVIYFSNGTTSPYTGTDKPFDTVFRRFLNGTDEERRQRLKIIPHVYEGNYLVKKSASNKPGILGTKVTQHHKACREQNYFEVSVDVRSSKIARGILSVVRGYTTRVVMDLGFVIEGQSPTELPERVFGAIRFHRFDFAHMLPLPGDHKGEAIPEEAKVEVPAGGNEE